MSEQPVDGGRRPEDAAQSRAIVTTGGASRHLPGAGSEIAAQREVEQAPDPDAPVVSPDQLKPMNRKLAMVGVVGTCVFLLAMLTDNRQYHEGQYVCVAIVIGLIIVVAIDRWARKNGLSRRD